jgi:tetratricopeptide (TPR) repeat protein
VYTDPRVIELVEKSFVPLRVHVKQNAADFKRLGERFGAQWTPTVVIVDPDGQERHRIEGFLPADDFLPQLVLGLAHTAFAAGDYAAAASLFERVVKSHPSSDAAPEAQYWEGVSRYKASGDAAALKETARRFTERFQDTSWAKKASVWRG